MKNKKILNICLLTFALISLITFILPIKKYEFLLEANMAVNIEFYVSSSILIASLAAIIIFAIINLFKDSYNFVLLMEALALVGFLVTIITVVMFSGLYDFRISLGYILVCIEVFFLSNFSQMARLFLRKDALVVNPKKALNNKKQKATEDGFSSQSYTNPEEEDNKTEILDEQNNNNKNA